MKENSAILVVSFGTSYAETREKTIHLIERKIAEKFPEYPVYCAWTSKMILARVQREEGIHIDNVPQALERMKHDGIQNILVQPTHMLNGIEHERMTADFQAAADQFASISIGVPILNSVKDCRAAIDSILPEFHLPEDEALIFMGHGTSHHADFVYAALDYMFQDLGCPNVFIATVEGYPRLESVMKQLKKQSRKKIHLAPWMLVAGDHALNDMAGDEPDSWKRQLEAAGYAVECHIRGLGEYAGIQDLILQHLQDLT